LSNDLNQVGHLVSDLNSFANTDQEFGVGEGSLMDFPQPNHLACQHGLP